MSATRIPSHLAGDDVVRWGTDFDELELRMDALRQAFTGGVRPFAMTDEIAERVHAWFDDPGEQLHQMHCQYPFGGRLGREECRFEPPVPYESDAGRPE
jgi:hypothetical protein